MALIDALPAKYRNSVKLGGLLMVGALLLGILFWLGGNGYLATSGDQEERPLNYLALKLESQFRRDIHKNPYSIDYSARPPNTIVIAVGYYESSDRGLLNSIVRGAGENARGVARDQFHIGNLGISTEWNLLPGKPAPISPPTTEEEGQ